MTAGCGGMGNGLDDPPDHWCVACGRFHGDRTIDQLARVVAIGANNSQTGFDECADSVREELLSGRGQATSDGTFCFCNTLRTYVIESIIDTPQFDEEADPYPDGLRADLEQIWINEQQLEMAVHRVLRESPASVANAVEMNLKRRG